MPNHNDPEKKKKPKFSAHDVPREEEEVVGHKHERRCQPVQRFVKCILILLVMRIPAPLFLISAAFCDCKLDDCHCGWQKRSQTDSLKEFKHPNDEDRRNWDIFPSAISAPMDSFMVANPAEDFRILLRFLITHPISEPPSMLGYST